MGRKIPGKKHRGVKDPEKQQENRLRSIKDKINAPPSNPDEQKIPKSLSRIIELKEKAKSWEETKKNKTSSLKASDSKIKKKRKSESRFQQHPKESDQHFLHRINKACEEQIRETAFENKYGVTIKRNPKTGIIEGVEKQKKDEIEEYLRKVRKEKKQPKKKKKAALEPKLTKSQKRQIKLKNKQKKKNENNMDEFNNYKDDVKFGEVVHAPPILPLPKKVQATNSTPRPGNKDLLLKSVLGNHTSKENIKQEKKMKNKLDLKKITNKSIDKKGKRKDLPKALRRQLETTQKEMIEVYRQLKRKKS